MSYLGSVSLVRRPLKLATERQLMWFWCVAGRCAFVGAVAVGGCALGCSPRAGAFLIAPPLAATRMRCVIFLRFVSIFVDFIF